jgi:NAD(P)-dependent dehydrogenase (short-subunit alcohol dehydrogenase family)
MSSELHGQTALITGSTSGIGRATADALATLGARVIISGRNAERGEKATDEIRAQGGSAEFIAAELTSSDSVRHLAEQAAEISDGHVDILINNAGIYPFEPTDSYTEEVFDAVYDTNVKAPYILTSILAPRMVAHGHGIIVNISTGLASRGFAGGALYGSSKAAVELLTKAWAAEYGQRGVRVNAVSPGVIATEGTAPLGDAFDDLVGATPSGRLGQPDEIASGVAFLVSDASRYIHGAILPVDGGDSAV